MTLTEATEKIEKAIEEVQKEGFQLHITTYDLKRADLRITTEDGIGSSTILMRDDKKKIGRL